MKNYLKLISIIMTIIMLFSTISCICPVLAEYEFDEESVQFDYSEGNDSIIEVESMRTRNSRTYLMSDGSFQSGVFSYAVNPEIPAMRGEPRDAGFPTIDDGTYFLSSDTVNDHHDNEDYIVLGSNSYGLISFSGYESFANYHINKLALYLPVVSGSGTVYAYIMNNVPDTLSFSSISNTSLTCVDYSSVISYGNDGNYIELDITSAVYHNAQQIVLFSSSSISLGKELPALEDETESVFAESGAPKVVLAYNYMVTSGVNEDFEYQEYDLGSAGQVYINKESGNLVIQRDDIATGNGDNAYNITSTFNSMSTLGRGMWMRNFDTLVTLLGILYIDENCTFSFLKSTGEENGIISLAENDYGFETLQIIRLNSSTITLFAGTILELTITLPSAMKYIITAGGGNIRYTFTTEYGLTGIEEKDENGAWVPVMVKNKVSDTTVNVIDADGSIMRMVTDNNTVTMAQVDNNGVIVGDVEVFNKDSEGNIISVVKNNNTVSTCTYDSENRMTSIEDNTGHKLTFTYSSGETDYRIASIKEYQGNSGGAEISYARYTNTCDERSAGPDCIYGNSDDVVTKYSFDNYCRLVCTQISDVSGNDLGAVTTEFNDEKEISKVFAAGRLPANLLKNHNFAAGTGDWTLADFGSGTTVSTGSGYSTNEAETDSGSLKISVSDVTATAGCCAYQTKTVASGVVSAGKKYTLSGYIKTDGMVQDENADQTRDYGACLMIRVYKTDGGTTTSTNHYSETLKDTGGKWERTFITVTLPENVTKIRAYLLVRNAQGTAYFDSVQLEEGDAPTQYNIIENNDFIYSTDNWTLYNVPNGDGVVNGKMNITGSPAQKRSVYQEFSLSTADKDNKYIISGKASANSVPVFDIVTGEARNDSGGNDTVRKYGIRVYVYYSDGSREIKAEPNFNAFITGNQYAQGAFDLISEADETKTPTKVRVVAGYWYNENAVQFDSFGVFRSTDIYEYEAEEETPETEYEDNTVYTYNNQGSVLTELEEDGTLTVYTYYNDGVTLHTITVTDGNHNQTYYAEYDSNENITSETDENGNITTYTYSSGILTRIETKNSSNVVIAYTNYNSDGDITSELDENGNVTTYTHTNGTITSKTVTNSGRTLSYSYSNEELSSVTANGNTYYYGKNVWGDETSFSLGSQPLLTNTYRANHGTLSQVTYGNEATESYTFNAYGQLLNKVLSGIGTQSYTYDSQGNTVFGKDTAAGRKIYYKYNDKGQFTGENVKTTSVSNVYLCDLYALKYQYDEEGRISRQSVIADGRSRSSNYTYTENQDGTSTVVSTMNTSRSVTSNYDKDGKITARNISTTTPFNETYTYDADNQLTAHTLGGETFTYTYDDNGSITEIKKNNTTVKSYVYNSFNELVRENDFDKGITTVFNYDNGGNISSKTEYTATTGTLGTPTGSKTYTYDTIWKDELTSYNGETISYDDAIGNPTTYRDSTMTWSGRRLMSYAKGADSISYTYDCNGLRTQKTVNGVTTDYYYVAGVLMYEKVSGSHELFYRYDNDGRLSMIVRKKVSSSSLDYFNVVTNAQGDVYKILGGSGSVSVCYTYDAWGNIISIKNGSGVEITNPEAIGLQNSIRYRSYVYDKETNLYYLQSRYYDPETGRFINCDAPEYIGANDTFDGWNGFAYCENEPVDYIDFSGLIRIKDSSKPYYVYIYYYKNDMVPNGHLDISFDKKNIYSYGTFNGKQEWKNQAAMKTYQYDNKKGGWFGKYKKITQIKLSEEEYVLLYMYYILSFKFWCDNVANRLDNDFKHLSILEYKIVKGDYKTYNAKSRNCATFVLDALKTVMPNRVKKAQKLWVLIKMSPYAVFRICCNI